MQKTPTVQQWLSHIPQSQTSQSAANTNFPGFPQRKNSQYKYLSRDPSFLSDDGSHCSSVESVLESRKPDPEAVLLGLGFGPRRNSSTVSRIPSRFLQPSKVLKSIDLQKFLEEQGDTRYRDQSSLPGSPAKLEMKTK